MNTGPITRFAASRPMSGKAGPGHSWTIVTTVPTSSVVTTLKRGLGNALRSSAVSFTTVSRRAHASAWGASRHTTLMPAVIPRTWRYRISHAVRSTVISDTHQTG